jgi:hypothetical protein
MIIFGFGSIRFLGQKLVQTGLTRFFRFGSVWLSFLGFGSVFSGFSGLARFFPVFFFGLGLVRFSFSVSGL